MSSYYYALWIPQHKEGIPSVKQSTLAEADLRDRNADPPLLVGGEIREDTELISLRYKLGDSPYRTLLFHKVDSIGTGFIVFKLNLDDDETDFLCRDLRCSMPKAIYHCIKHFYHVHQFHSSDDDSLLEAYFSKDPIDLKDEATLKKIIEVYLQSYINKYSGCIALCRKTLYIVSENIKQGIKYDTTKALIEDVISNTKNILDGESLYCDFLIDSHSSIVSPNQLQRIYGLRNELASYVERLEQQREQLVSNLGIKIGKIGLIASIIGSLVGVFVSLALGQCSSSELQESISGIRSEIKQIHTQDSLSKQTILEIRQQQDSILIHLHN